MDMHNLTREEAVTLLGEVNVASVEAVNCEPSNRVGGNGLMHNDPFLEYDASIEVDYEAPSCQWYNLPLGNCTLTAHYLISNDAEQKAKDNDCDVWEIGDYPIDYFSID